MQNSDVPLQKIKARYLANFRYSDKEFDPSDWPSVLTTAIKRYDWVFNNNRTKMAKISRVIHDSKGFNATPFLWLVLEPPEDNPYKNSDD